jgi:hypothetical protein
VSSGRSQGISITRGRGDAGHGDRRRRQCHSGAQVAGKEVMTRAERRAAGNYSSLQTGGPMWVRDGTV